MNKIRIAIAGYGNLGRGAQIAVSQNPDIELKAILTRRDPSSIKTAEAEIPVISYADAQSVAGETDVLLICGGSATDLPEYGPRFAELFNTVDSFDTHAKIPEYFDSMDRAAKDSGHLSLISAGWDPGLFSISRVYAEAALPQGDTYTFWGKGVSAGHSDAIRRIEGVRDAKQYTIPVESAIEAVRSGSRPTLTARQKHTRLCYVVAEEGADTAGIERRIKTMPNYFDEYDTTVNFITEEELARDHSGMPHGGFVLRSGETVSGKKQLTEFSLRLESNPEFTSSVLIACARAVARLHAAGSRGAISMLDIPPAMLSQKSPEALRRSLL